MGFGKVHSVVNGIWHTSLMEVLVWPVPSWPIVPIVLMSRAIPALFAQHALVDSWPFCNIVTTTMSVPMYVPSPFQSSKMYRRHDLCFVGLSHWDSIPNSGPWQRFHGATFLGCVHALVSCNLWDQTLNLQRYYQRKLWFLQQEGQFLDIVKESALKHTYRKESVRVNARLLFCSESLSWLSLKSTAKLQEKCRSNIHAGVCLLPSWSCPLQQESWFRAVGGILRISPYCC